MLGWVAVLYKKNMAQWIPWTREWTIEKGLNFADRMKNEDRPSSMQALEQFRSMVQLCRADPEQCVHTEDEFRTTADRISPGLGNVSCVYEAVIRCTKRTSSLPS